MKDETNKIQKYEIYNNPLDTNTSVKLGGKDDLVKNEEIIEEKDFEINPTSNCDESYNTQYNSDFQNNTIEENFNKYFAQYLQNAKLPANFNDLSQEKKLETIIFLYRQTFPALTPNLANISMGIFYHSECVPSPNEKPDWLDMEKFLRGQKFARDNYFGIAYAQYLSTAVRVRNWYTENPFKKGTRAYKDIMTVRNLHTLVRKKCRETTKEKFNEITKIKNPICPSREYLLKDLQATCAVPVLGQCPHLTLSNVQDINSIPLNQAEMCSTQFGFFALIILYPTAFGIHNATNEDLEALCHVWQAIGFLLGVDDKFNVCRGSLEEVKDRSRDFIEYWIKPTFRHITPEWEHMLRCVIEGANFYIPTLNFEVSLYFITNLLNLHMPRLYYSMSYRNWISYNVLKFYFSCSSWLPGLKTFLIKSVHIKINQALQFSENQHAILEQISNEILSRNL